MALLYTDWAACIWRATAPGQDDQQAVACFEKAVDLGFEGSMLALAQMYQQGRGVVQNTVKARLLYAQAGFDPTELADHS